MAPTVGAKSRLYIGASDAHPSAAPINNQNMTYQVETFRGISQGWKPVGRPRLYKDAIRLRQTVALVRPDFVTRTRCLSPELPSFL